MIALMAPRRDHPNGAYRVVLDGDSYRTPRPLPHTPKKSLVKGGQKQ